MEQVFSMIPPRQGSYAAILVLSLLLLSLLGIFIGLALTMKQVSITVTDESITIRSLLFGRTLPLGVIRGSEARVLYTSKDTELLPVVRTSGVGLPGFQSGWYRLHNGEKALLFVTSREKLVYIPTTQGYSLLLSVSDPEGLVRALQRP